MKNEQLIKDLLKICKNFHLKAKKYNDFFNNIEECGDYYFFCQERTELENYILFLAGIEEDGDLESDESGIHDYLSSIMYDYFCNEISKDEVIDKIKGLTK